MTHRGELYLALIHHPIRSPKGGVIATAITNVDLHDFARLGRTYDCRRVFIVTPVTRQQELVQSICDHWTTGSGARKNPDRMEAMRLLEVQPSIEHAIVAIESARGARPSIAVTGAALAEATDDPRALAGDLASGRDVLLLFGTGWGLTEETLGMADRRLQPIKGRLDGYNHLSVRSAAAIILDRLFRND
ncbi:MAG: RNA methyltransferase [Myxococcales bacterium]|nr:RNA methyltransferase [Myxococcales bacterium]